MATLFSTLETISRRHLNEATANYWSSAELIALMELGAHDLWRSVNDLHAAHFLTRDTTNVTLAASTATLTGVPSDCVRVHMIEPLDLTSSGSHRGLTFTPRSYTAPEFQAARASDSLDPSGGGVIYYDITGAGGPVSAPTVRVAPTVTAAVTLAFTYVPTLGALTSASTNPIPGESDNALVCWTVAYARAKEREDRAPDPTWLQMYATEKRNLVTSLTPRQDQEMQVTAAVFEPWWN